MEKTAKRGRVTTLTKTELADYLVVRSPRYSEGPPVSMVVHHRRHCDSRATFAMGCIERWALVAAEPDGESSDGRQKLRRMTPEEVVAHATICSEKAFAAFDKLGWMASVPSYDELLEAVKDQEDGND